jgi:squalene synthase HpnC
MAIDHYENFPVGSVLLPRRLRHPTAVIYAFARSADDIADEGDDPPPVRLERLRHYHGQLQRIAAGEMPTEALFDALAQITRQHDLPPQLFYDLIDAFSQDVVKKRYADYSELLDYCRRSANPIGRLMLRLFQRDNERNCADADRICTSLQLINFWQDVAIDHKKGRIYLPQDEMSQHGVTAAQIERGDCSGGWRSLMAAQIERTRALLFAGAPLAARLGGRFGLEIRLTIEGGRRILELIEASGGDVFRHRPQLRLRDWLLMLARSQRALPEST